MAFDDFLNNIANGFTGFFENSWDWMTGASKDLANSLTGHDLTGSQIAQNEFNSAEALKSYERSKDSQLRDFDFQREMLQRQQDYNTMMSSTAYQRAVEDMKKAGLNPYLAYQQGGAQVVGSGLPQGAMAQSSPASAGNSANSALGLASFINSIASIKNADASQNIAEASKTRAEANSAFALLKLLSFVAK